MISRQQASQLRYGDEVHYGECKREVGPRGGVKVEQVRLRVSGSFTQPAPIKRPDEWYLPIKFGLKESHRLEPYNADQFHLANECPLLAEAVR